MLCVVRWNAWFGMPAEPVWEGDTITYRFHCFGEDSVPGFVQTPAGWQDLRQPEALQLLLLGDVHNSMDRAQWNSIAARHTDIDAYAQLGDFVERCYFYWWQRLYAELDSTAFADLPVMTTPGNHEYNKGLVKHLDPMWYEIFHHPANGPVDYIGSTYYVDFPHLRFIAIDTDALRRLRDMLRVQTWLKGAIKGSGDRFVVVMMHHPVISTGAGRQNWLIRWVFRRVLLRADLVFAGHDHNYARRLPFVDTNSAKKFYLSKLNRRDTRVASGFQMYELLTITADTLRMRTYVTDLGELYDDVCIVRHDDGSRETIDYAAGWIEKIELPEKYQNRTGDIKVRRFLNKRRHRMANRTTPSVHPATLEP